MATTNRQKIRDMREISSPQGGEMLASAFLGRNYRIKVSALKRYINSDMPSSISIVDVLPELPTTNIVEGRPYAIGPVRDAEGNEVYELWIYYAFKTPQWRSMGYMNSASIQIVQEMGDSETLVMSQKAVTEAIRPIVMTQEEFDALVANGEITDDDMTIRYIVES